MLVLLALVLALACWTDLRRRRIPNRLVLAGLMGAVLLDAWARVAGWPALAGDSAWAPWLGLLLGTALLMPLHLAGGLAAGDVKLMAVAAAWLGPTAGLHAVLATWVAGGVLALVYRFAARASSLPYAPAIAVGSLLSGWRVVASA